MQLAMAGIATYLRRRKENKMRKSALLGFLLAGVCSYALTSFAQAQKATPLATGNFTGIAHKTAGKALILRTADGGHVLRLENFSTSNGPDVRVYLVKGTNGANSDFIKAGGGNFVDLGALKGNIGDQNYTIPANVNLDEYKSVSIWCRRFGINFAGTNLEPAGQPAPGTNP
jgi:hypothetical protein